MNIFKLILAFVVLLIAGAFAYIAFVMDAPVTQQQITKEIPHDRPSAQ